MSATTEKVIVVGAGIGGLAAAADLARRGLQVTVVDRAAGPGGKMRRLQVGGAAVDAGPTVFTMRWAFEGLFADAGQRLTDHLRLESVEVLARHAWRGGGRLDLFRDIERSADAIGEFAGAADAKGYREFCARSAGIYRTLAAPFIAAERPSAIDLVRRVGWRNLDELWRTLPFTTMWSALAEFFTDPRLRQLFGRYATYCGSSPLQAPATLMLVAHVEQDGVWRVPGGMHEVAKAVQALGASQGATYRYGDGVASIVVEQGRAAGVVLESGERLSADAVLFNGDASALATGLLGEAVAPAVSDIPRLSRSLSAITWCLNARTRGFPLEHHNVFFAEDYEAEFNAIFRQRGITDAPTVYLCAQDRGGSAPEVGDKPERLLVLINAPPDGDVAPIEGAALQGHQERTFALLEACGLQIDRSDAAQVVTTPTGFNGLFPATGGALYGRANHGSLATFQRNGAATKVPGLYVAGGSVHPGPGIPMAVLSGRLCAARMAEDRLGRGARRSGADSAPVQQRLTSLPAGALEHSDVHQIFVATCRTLVGEQSVAADKGHWRPCHLEHQPCCPADLEGDAADLSQNVDSTRRKAHLVDGPGSGEVSGRDAMLGQGRSEVGQGRRDPRCVFGGGSDPDVEVSSRARYTRNSTPRFENAASRSRKSGLRPASTMLICFGHG